jgi:potassium channel subfamily K, other eukaryote
MLDETNYVEVETSPLQVAREYRTIPGRLAPTLTQDFTDYMHSKSMYTFCIVNLAVYILVAVVAYSFIFEDWPVIDSIYFACVTFTTVGYGDVTPTNDLSRAFTCLFALYGIVILGLLIGLIGETIVERNNAFMAVAQASAQERVLKLFGDADTVDNDTRTAQALKEKTLLEAMRDVVALETPIILVIVIISLAIGRYEGWSAVASVYYGTITASTIGFGDFSPATPEMRIVIIFFIPIAVSVFCEVLGRIAGAYMERQTVTAEKEFLNRQVTLTDLERMDVNKDGKVTW